MWPTLLTSSWVLRFMLIWDLCSVTQVTIQIISPAFYTLALTHCLAYTTNVKHHEYLLRIHYIQFLLPIWRLLQILPQMSTKGWLSFTARYNTRYNPVLNPQRQTHVWSSKHSHSGSERHSYTYTCLENSKSFQSVWASRLIRNVQWTERLEGNRGIGWRHLN